MPRRRVVLLLLFAAIAAVLFLFPILSGFLTDWWWFKEIGYQVVFTRELVTRGLLFLLAAGLTSVVAIQALVILGGTLRLMPLTGVTLPLVSYGGSSILANFILLGILLRISAERGGAPGAT